MGLKNGRARVLAAFALFTPQVWAAAAATGHAQSGDEVIVDPELAGGTSSPPRAPAGDEVIVDPELGGAPSQPTPPDNYGWGEVYQEDTGAPKPPQTAATEKKEEEESDPLANTGLARLEMLGQVAADLHHEGDLEDAYKTRFRFGGEVELRRSRRLRVMLGSRLDFFWAVPAQNDNIVRDRNERALDEARYELDVFATAAYVDTTVADGVHLRIGQQAISLGRMDAYSPTDILAVYDMRPQPRLDLSANKLAQPAVRLDWDVNSWTTVQMVYVPWFQPNLSRPNRDRYVGAVVGGTGGSDVPGSFDKLVNPSQQVKASEASLRFVGPPPDFKTPQAEIRTNFRAQTMEFALSGGTALEKLPAVYVTPALNQYMLHPSDKTTQAQLAIAVASGQPVLDIEYHRYYSLGFDGSFDLSPVSIGFEFAYSPERHMYAATSDHKHLAQPDVSQQITDPSSATVTDPVTHQSSTIWTPSNVTNKSIRKGVPVVQGALHIEWLKGETFALVGEAFWINALSLPHDLSRDWWGFIPKTGAYAGGMMAASYSAFDQRLRLDMTAMVLVGPSYVLVPHAELKAKDGLYFDCGLQIFEGPAPGLNGAQNINIGGLLNGYDQAFVGIRWLP